jgi:hypothetical protein
MFVNAELYISTGSFHVVFCSGNCVLIKSGDYNAFFDGDTLYCDKGMVIDDLKKKIRKLDERTKIFAAVRKEYNNYYQI